MAAVSGWKLYLAKFLPDVLVVSVGMGIAVGITSFLYGIHWGNIFLSAVLVLLTIMASSAFGLMLYYIFNNLIITIIILFINCVFLLLILTQYIILYYINAIFCFKKTWK